MVSSLGGARAPASHQNNEKVELSELRGLGASLLQPQEAAGTQVLNSKWSTSLPRHCQLGSVIQALLAA